MGLRDFDFVSSLTVAARVSDVHAVLVDLEHYVDWWPQVRAVAKIDDDTALVICRSALPYELSLKLHADAREQRLLRVDIEGPIRGVAQWRLTPVDGGTRLDFSQHVRAIAPSFVVGSYLLRPVLRWNHAAMMRGCAEGLRARFDEGFSGGRGGRTPAQSS